MIKYNTFLAVFIISIIAFVVFMVFYIQAIFGVVAIVAEPYAQEEPNPFQLLSTIFSMPVVISGIILGLSSLAYRIMGIVAVAKNKMVSDGEKALWIIGFILMSFITGIVFLVMAKGKKMAQ